MKLRCILDFNEKGIERGCGSALGLNPFIPDAATNLADRLGSTLAVEQSFFNISRNNWVGASFGRGIRFIGERMAAWAR
jgi:hypothetical protein